MTTTETADILRQFNKWLRGNKDGPQLESREISKAIDAAVEMIDRLEAAEKSDAESLAMYRKARDERDTYKAAFEEWHQKTGWVQQGINDGSIPPTYLGWHRADVMADMLKSARRDYCVLEGYYTELAEKLAAVNHAVDEAYQRGYATGQEEIGKERDALRVEVERLRTDGASAVQWAPGSAYWSEVLVELFGPDARKGIDVLERRWQAALERADTAEALLRQALEALDSDHSDIQLRTAIALRERLEKGMDQKA